MCYYIWYKKTGKAGRINVQRSISGKKGLKKNTRWKMEPWGRYQFPYNDLN